MPGKQLLIPDQDLQKLVPFFTKDYSQEAMSFLPNYHRTLNYWAEGVNILPPQLEESKRRKFSFFDLVWLGIVRELRDFGMEKERIAVLKSELLSPPDHREITKHLKESRKEVEELLAKNYGIGTDKIRSMLDEYLSLQLKVQTLSYSLLSIYIYYALGRDTDVSLLIDKAGHHQFISPDYAYSALKEGVRPVVGSHISISLKEVIHFFVTLPQVKDEVKQQFLSPEEWRLIEESRKPGLTAIKVSYNEEGKMKKLELTRKKKIDIEARLTEIVLKGGFEQIEMHTQDGEPIIFRSTEKIKL